MGDLDEKGCHDLNTAKVKIDTWRQAPAPHPTEFETFLNSSRDL
jgi:hypothetical protein